MAKTTVRNECLGVQTACDDGNACTIDVCDGVSGCTHPAAFKGLVCGASHTCNAGACGLTCAGVCDPSKRTCVGSGAAYVPCEMSSDGCTHYGGDTACPAGTLCAPDGAVPCVPGP